MKNKKAKRKAENKKATHGTLDECVADELEEKARRAYEEYAEDEGIGESEYFSTCEYTMIPTDDDAINNQGS